MRAIFKVHERHAFCIFLSTPLALLPTSLCRVASKSLDCPPSTSKMILVYWAWSCTRVYLLQFPSEWRILHGQKSSCRACSPNLLTILASTLFALSSWSIYRNILIHLYLCCFIDWVWLDRWIPREHIVYQALPLLSYSFLYTMRNFDWVVAGNK